MFSYRSRYPRVVASGQLPAARLQQVLRIELANVQALHGFAQLFGGFEHGLGVLEMRGRFDDGAGALARDRWT